MPPTRISLASSFSSSITLTTTSGPQRATHRHRTITESSTFTNVIHNPFWINVRRSRQPLTVARDLGSDPGSTARLSPVPEAPLLAIRSPRDPQKKGARPARSSTHPYNRPPLLAGTTRTATPQLARLPRFQSQAPFRLVGFEATPTVSPPVARFDPSRSPSTQTHGHANEVGSILATPAASPDPVIQPKVATSLQSPDSQATRMPSRVPQTPRGSETFQVPQALFEAYKNNEDILLSQISEFQDRLKASAKRENRLSTSLDQAKIRLKELERARKQDVEAQEEDLGCPICASVLVDPYGFVPCGHCVCGACAVQWIDTQSANHGQATCPECRDHLSINCPIVANRPLDKVINKWIEKRTAKDGNTWDGHQDWLERKESWEAYKLVHPDLIDKDRFRLSLRDQHLPRDGGQIPGVTTLTPPFLPWFFPPSNLLNEGDVGLSEEERLVFREMGVDRGSSTTGDGSLYSDPARRMAEILGVGRRGAASGMPETVHGAMRRRQGRDQGLMEAQQRRQQERQHRAARGWVHQGFGPSDAEDIFRQAIRGMIDSETPDVFSFLDGMRSMNMSMAPMGGSLAVFSHFESRL